MAIKKMPFWILHTRKTLFFTIIINRRFVSFLLFLVQNRILYGLNISEYLCCDLCTERFIFFFSNFEKSRKNCILDKNTASNTTTTFTLWMCTRKWNSSRRLSRTGWPNVMGFWFIVVSTNTVSRVSYLNLIYANCPHSNLRVAEYGAKRLFISNMFERTSLSNGWC